MNYLYIVLLLFINQSYAQSFIFHYDTYYNGHTYQNILQANDSLSIWEDLPGPDNEEGDQLLKYISSRSVVLTDHVFQKMYLVADSLHPMQWEMLPFTKEILTYPCKSARTVFRGREYKAYYTALLPSHIGPWKFGGLPGAILEVTSSDASYRFQAASISQTDAKITPPDPLKQEEPIAWTEYCYRFIKAVDQYARYLKTTNDLPGGKVNIKIDRPEIIYPLVQSGEGIDTE